MLGLQFGYDIWGNLHAKNQIAGKQQGEYFQQTMNAQNRFAGWSYDAAGNLLNDGAHNYQFDPEGRIKCMDAGVNCASPAASYVYSVEGRRVKRTVGASSTLYLYDGGAVLSEFANPSQGVGTWQKDYIYLNGALLASESATEGTRFHFSDHLGTPRVITDATGVVLSRHDYYPYGREITSSTDGETHKFTGKEHDSESSLDYFIARYYSSAQGRFLSPDVPFADQDLSDPQSWNLYAYVRNNPMRLVDPDGQGAWDVINGVVEGGVNFVVNTVVAVGQLAVAIGNDGGRVGYNTSQLVAEPLITAGQEYSSRGVSGVANAVLDQGEQGATAIVTEAVLTGGLAATARVNSIKPVTGVQANRAAGLSFQAKVLESEGLRPNTRSFEAVDPKTGKPGSTIPDAVRPNGQTVDSKLSKSGRAISDSEQLRRQSVVSQQAGQRAQVVVNRGTKVSKKIRERMDVKEGP